MKKEPLLIAFASQKGGVGKSAFTVLVVQYPSLPERFEGGCRGLRLPSTASPGCVTGT